MNDYKLRATNKLIENLTSNLKPFNEFWSSLSLTNQKIFWDILYDAMIDFDFLNNIFNLQDKLDKYILEKKARWEPTEKDILIALQQEIAECIENTDFKWWSSSHYNKNELKKEGIDVVHFLISFFLKIGLTAFDIHNAYIEKNEINFKRADSNY